MVIMQEIDMMMDDLKRQVMSSGKSTLLDDEEPSYLDFKEEFEDLDASVEFDRNEEDT